MRGDWAAEPVVVSIAEGLGRPLGNHGSAALRPRRNAWCLSFFCPSTVALQKLNFMSVQFDGWLFHVTHHRCQAALGRVRCLSPFQPTADGTLVNSVTRGKMWLAEAFEVANAMVNDVDAEHGTGCGLLSIYLSLWLNSVPTVEERQLVAIELRSWSPFSLE